jgi:hypothetical protein
MPKGEQFSFEVGAAAKDVTPGNDEARRTAAMG